MTAAPKTSTRPKASSRKSLAAAPCSALVKWDMGGMAVLIPRRRGGGYLRCPLYHNYVRAISDIEMDEKTNACGLDGYLMFEFLYVTDHAKRDAITARIMPRLANHYGFKEWREDSKAFWEVLLPNEPSGASAAPLNAINATPRS